MQPKGKVKRSGPILTPTIIKLIVAGVIALITFITVGVIINNSNAKVIQSYETVYLRINNLSNEVSPLRELINRIKDSDLRSYTDAFLSSLNSTNVTLSGITNNIGVKTDNISKTIQDQEDANLNSLRGQLEDAIYTGTYDRTLGTQLYYQITMLLNYEETARSKTTNQQFADLLDKSTEDLLILQKNFKDWNDHN